MNFFNVAIETIKIKNIAIGITVLIVIIGLTIFLGDKFSFLSAQGNERNETGTISISAESSMMKKHILTTIIIIAAVIFVCYQVSYCFDSILNFIKQYCNDEFKKFL